MPLRSLVAIRIAIFAIIAILGLGCGASNSPCFECVEGCFALAFDGEDDFVTLAAPIPTGDLTIHFTGRVAEPTVADPQVIVEWPDARIEIEAGQLTAKLRTWGWHVAKAAGEAATALRDGVTVAVGVLETAAKTPAAIDRFSSTASTPVISVGSSGHFDERIREIGNVLYDPDADNDHRYRILYSGYRPPNRKDGVFVGQASSSDKQSWTKAEQPLIDHPLEDPYLVKKDDVYYVFAEDKGDDPFRNIRRFHSRDFVEWIDDGDVLDISEQGWDSRDVSSPVVLVDGDGRWSLLYEGRAEGQNGMIGLAVSDDGLHFERVQGAPVLGAGCEGCWDDGGVVPDDIAVDGGLYYLSYHGQHRSKNGWRTGLATSSDLVTWTRYGRNPVSESNVVTLANDGGSSAFRYKEDRGIYAEQGRGVDLTIQIYVGATLAAHTLTDGERSEETTTSMLLLGRAADGSAAFGGQIDGLSIWDIALTAEQIANLDADGLCAGPAAVAHWLFDEGGGQRVTDVSGATHGQLGSDPEADANDPVWVAQ